MSSRTLLTILLATIAGCGGGGPAQGLLPPHGGALVPLTGAEGFAEVVRDGPRIVVYFLDAARKPLAPAPTGVRLKLQGARQKTVDLQPVADPEKAGALSADVTDAGGISGELSAKLDGRPITAAINAR